MKEFNYYLVSSTIYLVPHLRNGNSLRIEFNPEYVSRFVNEYHDILDRLRKLKFSCSETQSVFNTTKESNVIDIVLPLYLDEKPLITDLGEYLQEILGKGQVLDRTRSTIRKESHKMKT